jgi:hypothetical protein
MRPDGPDRLYGRLPAHVRTRDGERGEALRALTHILQEEFDLLEADIEQLYENWFVETAQEWVIPYIGDLLAVRNLRPIKSAGFSVRAYVANTLRYRQGKGTPGVLEQVASDVSGWQARVVEFFQLLGTTQHMNHVRLGNQVAVNVRSASRMQLVDTAFDTCAHTAEVRRIDPALGRHNIPNVGLFLWRLQPYFVERGTPRMVPLTSKPFVDAHHLRLAGRLFHLGPLNRDFPIFNRPLDQTDMRHIATERNVPTTVRRLAMQANKGAYLDVREPVIACYFDGVRLLPSQIMVCHLSWEDVAWSEPRQVQFPQVKVAVDPERGRLLVMEEMDPPDRLEVSYTYGFPGDLGGGPYSRNADHMDLNEGGVELQDRSWKKFVAKGSATATITAALTEWSLQPAGTKGIIAIVDNATYVEDLSITIPPGSDLLIIACKAFDAVTAQAVDATERRAHVLGNVTLQGAALTAEQPVRGKLAINGLLIEGTITVAPGDLGVLELGHCSVVPSTDPAAAVVSHVLRALAGAADGTRNEKLEVTVRKCIVRGIDLDANVDTLCIADSIVDHAMEVAIRAPGSICTIDNTTVFSKERSVAAPADAAFAAEEAALEAPAMRTLYASGSIFTGRVIVERKQEGCVRFSSLPSGCRVPRRFRCQPDLALENITNPAKQAAVRIRMAPQFSSQRYGDPDYAQLDRSTDPGIRSGADDGSEMGAFYFLEQPQREANLRAAIEEYLPFGLQAGLLFIDEADAFRPASPITT